MEQYAVKVALFSDIHGNITGLQAVLAHLDGLGGADIVFAAGDLVGGGPGTEDLLDLLMDRNVRLIRGNAEEVSLNLEGTIHNVSEPHKRLAYETVAWLHAQLTQPYWNLLAALPLTEMIALDHECRLFVCHAAPDDPWARVCSPRAPLADLQRAYGRVDADAIAYGHWHRHHVLSLDSKLLINVASVGLRRDGLSAWTLIEYTDGRLIVQQYTVPYDVAEEARLTQERGVPQP